MGTERLTSSSFKYLDIVIMDVIMDFDFGINKTTRFSHTSSSVRLHFGTVTV